MKNLPICAAGLSQELVLKSALDGTIIETNSAWPRLLGWTEADLANASFLGFVHPDDLESTREGLARVTQAPSPSNFCNRLRRRDGSYAWLSWTAVGEGDYLCAAGHDVSGEREAADALGRQHETLYALQKSEVIGALSGGIAHEYNNAFQNILASMELVRKLSAAGRASEAERFIASAMTSAQRAAALTQQWFGFSRSSPTLPRRIAIDRLIEGVGELLRRSMPNSINVEVDPSPDSWDAYCDENQLERAVLNLAIRARDAMPDGGRLVIRACNAELDADAASASGIRPGQYVCIDVIDSAPGMSEDALQRAFEAPSPIPVNGRNPGLGLTMVRWFARRNGGDATMKSEIGTGTTATILLPRNLETGEPTAA